MENNIAITGDEARLLIKSLTCESMVYSGPMVPAIAGLIFRLNDISINQPPQETQQPGANNDAEHRS